MMDGVSIVQELNNTIAEAQKARNDWAADMERANFLEAEYKKQKSLAIMKARAEKIPATIMDAVISGWESVNTARLKWKNAQSIADAQKELVLIKKKEIDVLQNYAKNEWQIAQVV